MGSRVAAFGIIAPGTDPGARRRHASRGDAEDFSHAPVAVVNDAG
jgi:hypothetical protein